MCLRIITVYAYKSIEQDLEVDIYLISINIFGSGIVSAAIWAYYVYNYEWFLFMSIT